MEGRSKKGGPRVQVVHRSRDEGAMKYSFEDLCESSLFDFSIAFVSCKQSVIRVELLFDQRQEAVARLLSRENGCY